MCVCVCVPVVFFVLFLLIIYLNDDPVDSLPYPEGDVDAWLSLHGRPIEIFLLPASAS